MLEALIVVILIAVLAQLRRLAEQVRQLRREVQGLRSAQPAVQAPLVPAPPKAAAVVPSFALHKTAALTQTQVAAQKVGLAQENAPTENAPAPALVASTASASLRAPAPGAVSSAPRHRREWPTGALFAVAGALLTLVGAAFVLSQLARAGIFTPELQWGLAVLLAAALYTLSGRASELVGGALRGLGYGIAALCIGALSQRGVLPAGLVLLLLLLLSLLVGLHARAKGQLLGMGVAVLGALIATWMLADNLPSLLPAQSALLAVTLATVAGSVSLRAGAGVLLGLLPLGVAGLLMTAYVHPEVKLGADSAWVWVAQATLLALGSIWVTPKQAGDQGQRSWQSAFAAVCLVLGVGLCLRPLSFSMHDPSALLLLALVLSVLTLGRVLGWRGLNAGGHSAGALLGGPLQGPNPANALQGGWSDPVREALLSAALATWSAWLLWAFPGSAALVRFLPLATTLALYGRWTNQRVWRVLGTLAASALLVLGELSPTAALLSLGALVAAARVGGRSGFGLGAAAGVLLYRYATSVLGWGAWPLGVTGSALPATALLAVMGLSALVALLSAVGLRFNRWRGWQGAALLAAACVIGALLPLDLIAGRLLGRAGATPLGQLTGLGLLLGALTLPLALHWRGWGQRGADSVAPLLGWRPQHLLRCSEWLALGVLVLGLAALDVGALPVALLLGALAVAAPFVRLETPWTAVSALLLALGVGLGVQVGLSADGWRGAAALAGLTTTLVSALALWLVGSVSGRARLPLPAAARPVEQRVTALARRAADKGGAAWGMVVTLLLLSAAANLARWGAWQGVSGPYGLPQSAVLLLCGLGMLLTARQRGLPAVWWTGLLGFGLGAAKLILLDLDELGLTVRGVGIALVGLLLLGIGQLAPKAEVTRADQQPGL